LSYRGVLEIISNYLDGYPPDPHSGSMDHGKDDPGRSIQQDNNPGKTVIPIRGEVAIQAGVE